MNSDKIQELITRGTDWAIGFAPKFLMAAVLVIVGFYLAKKIGKVLKMALEKAKLEQEISDFLGSVIDIILKAAILLFAAGIIGVELTALIGLLAAAGFAVGLALQGFLGNFASGLTILFFKPYRIGDWVQVSDHFGKVQSIQIFSTTLETPGDKTLVIPNGQVTDNIITNFSTKGTIRLELNVTMPYEESFPKVKKVIEKALADSNFILHEPAANIGIESYDSHNLVVAVRPYIHPDDYWDATFEVYGNIKQAFNTAGIKAAYSEGVELGPIGD